MKYFLLRTKFLQLWCLLLRLTDFLKKCPTFKLNKTGNANQLFTAEYVNYVVNTPTPRGTDS